MCKIEKNIKSNSYTLQSIYRLFQESSPLADAKHGQKP